MENDGFNAREIALTRFLKIPVNKFKEKPILINVAAFSFKDASYPNDMSFIPNFDDYINKLLIIINILNSSNYIVSFHPRFSEKEILSLDKRMLENRSTLEAQELVDTSSGLISYVGSSLNMYALDHNIPVISLSL